jgi:hypothetical protein
MHPAPLLILLAAALSGCGPAPVQSADMMGPGNGPALLTPGQDSFTNLPPGLTVRTHARWAGSVPSGWNITPRRGTPVIVADPSSPTGGALEFRYPAGHPDGHEVGVVWTGGPGARADEMFLGVVMRYSSNWTSHNNEVKLHLWAGEGSWFGIFDGCWNDRVPQWKIASRALNPVPRPNNENCWTNNKANSPRYTPGEWVKQELYVRRSTGTVMLWVDGTLVAEHHNVGPVRTMSFVEFQHAGTWGGGGGNVPQAQVWSVAETLLAWR